ncbi:hypothetical protein Acr_12g0008720 [Actinidia rufa]|uniref:Uncharacterized protein n=1 Tax=Actinidia rufa TaxID=165716 RepID=A0A7J0FI28_9ERIC|nr:hypothetical protein Acr_12g0008720 [Actinidia rufa]
MGRANERFMSFTAIPTFQVISPQARMTLRILNLIKNSWGDDSSDESSGNLGGISPFTLKHFMKWYLTIIFMAVNKSEKQLCSSSASDRDGNPCSDQCYLRLKVAKDLPEGSAVNYLRRFGNRSSGEEGRTPGSPSAEETGDDLTGNDFILWIHVQVKKNGSWNPGNLITLKALCPPKLRVNLLQTNSATLLVFLDKGLRTVPDVEQKGISHGTEWLNISRNLLSGLKTCIELSSDMFDDKAGMPQGAVGMPSSFSEDEET